MGRRILLLNTDLEIGGTPTVVRELATRLHDPGRGIEIEVACVAPWGPVADEIRRRGINVTALDGDDAFDLPFVVWRLVRHIRARRIDTVFSFLVHANTVAAVAGRFCGEVRFLQSIQTTQPRPRWHWWMQALVHPAADAVVVPSESVAEIAMERVGVPPEKVVIIPNAIDPAAFRSTGPASQRPLDQSGGGAAFRIAFLGRFDPVKRVPDLLAAMAKLNRPDMRLDLYGDGDLRHDLADRIDRLGLRQQVQMHGFVPAPQALANSDLLVLPSEAEGFGLVLIEAMAAGVPIVATDAPGIRNVVRHGDTGLLVPVGDSDALAAAIQRCADDPALRRHLVEQAAAEVERKYTWQRILPQYAQLLGLETPAADDPPITPSTQP